MPEIQPIRGWRYTPKAGSIDKLLAPLFDVVTPEQKQLLYAEKYNSIHLTVPGSANMTDQPDLLDQWKRQGIIAQDKLPGMYVYYQHATDPLTGKEISRKGFIANLRLADFEEQILLRHESTMPGSVSDRGSVLASSQLNASATHGLYTDEQLQLESVMEETMRFPLFEVTDYQGVTDSLGVIHDYQVIKKFQEVLSEKQVILADGHHRYQASLDYMHSQKKQNPNHTGKEGYNFHMMYLTNTESSGLQILPTHRLVKKIDVPTFLEKASTISTINQHDSFSKLQQAMQLKENSVFGLSTNSNHYLIELNDGFVPPTHLPETLRNLDVNILHHTMLDHLLGFPIEQQYQNPDIVYERNPETCQQLVSSGEFEGVFLLNPIDVEDVKRVCYSGHVLPPKTTFFYPKVVCGLLFSSIADHEFSYF